MTDLIHGSIVSYQAEDIHGTGTYGTLITGTSLPVMVWPGLVESFDIGVEETYDETQYLAAHGDTSRLENTRNVITGEELAFSMSVYPQKTQHWNLIPFITGSTSGFSDTPDSLSFIKELNSKFTVYTGVMVDAYKVDIPERGKIKQTISGFAGHQVAPSVTDPLAAGSGTHASENATDQLVWNDVVELKMDATATPSTAIDHCVGDISFGFTSEIAKKTHPESTLTTKICGVEVMSRKMEVSLTLTYVDQTFISLVTAGTKQNIKLKIGTTPDATTFVFTGLLWPKYIAKAEPNDLIGDVITSVVDQHAFTYSTA